MKFYYLIPIFLIMVMGFVSSTTDIKSLPPVRSGDCFIVQEDCGNCSYINITSVKYPNQTINLLNYPMGSLGGTTWYNNSFCDSTLNGNYIFGVKGDPDGITDSELIQIYVNPTGIESNGYRTTILTVAIIVIMIVSVLFFLAFMYFKQVSAKYSFLVMSVIFFLVSLNLILNSLTNEVVDPTILSLFGFISAASYYFYWLCGGLLCIILFLTVLTSIWDSVKAKRVQDYGGYDG